MAKPTPIELRVIGSVQVSPHLQRITLGGAALATFGQQQEGAYIKLFVPAGSGERPLLRTYTIRGQRPDEIDIDFVLHEHNGPASDWAATEFNSMRALRRLLKQDKEIPKTNLYISSYWKMGQSEDEHKIAKRQDLQLQAA